MITKEEYDILNMFELSYKKCYIIRDDWDDIYISKEKPFTENDEVLFEGGEFLKLSIFNHLFKTIRYGDKKFKRIIDYIKEYEKNNEVE